MPGATCPKLLSARTVVDVAGRIISKVAAREGAIISLCLVEHRDMWRDALRLDQPVQHRSCPVGGIGHKPLRLETEALFCPFDHGPSGANLGLADFAGGLDANDDAELLVNANVVGVSKELQPLVSSGSLHRRIGGPD